MGEVYPQGKRARFYQSRHSPQVLQPPLSVISFPIAREVHGKRPYNPSQKKALELGLPDQLPIMAQKAQIMRAIDKSDVVIIVAETGAGKSTMVPQFAAEAGYQVVVTQPRRMAAVNLANYVAAQMKSEVGNQVGYQHGYAHCCKPDSKITFLTDGLRLSQELAGHHNVGEKSLFIIDEAHEKNMYMETLIARYLQILADPNQPTPKLVIMSATLNVEKMRHLFGSGTPVIKVPGRTYPVTERAKGPSILSDAVTAVRDKKNTLIFLPGKQEINQMQFMINNRLEQEGLKAVVLPLHSKLSSDEQQKTLKAYDVPKIVLATNVAEASITIPDVDLVIMSGLVKRVIVENGVECLTLMSISKFNYFQQQGRAGRTHPGEFIYHGHIPFELLPSEPPAEIQNSKLESLMLRLLSSREYPHQDSIERLPFPSKISQKRFNETFRVLKDLNLTGPQGHITTEGRAVACLPVDVRVGKMLIAAQQKSLVYADQTILRNAIDVAVVMQNGGVVDSNSKDWRALCPDEKDSDAIAQAIVFQLGEFMTPIELEENGIDIVSFKRCAELKEILLRRFKIEPMRNVFPEMDFTVHQAVLESIWAGMGDSIYQLKNTDKGGMYVAVNNNDSSKRSLDRDSVLSDEARLVTGMPFDILSFRDPENPQKIPLLHMTTRIDPKWLQRYATPSIKQRLGSFLIHEINAQKRQVSQQNQRRGNFRNQPRGAGYFNS